MILVIDYTDLMKCILWNCREANKPQFRRSIRYLVKKFSTDILAVFETHAGGAAAVAFVGDWGLITLLGWMRVDRVVVCGCYGGRR